MKRLNDSGLITLILLVFVIVIGMIILVFLRVQSAQR